jgi:hypothetical protein
VTAIKCSNSIEGVVVEACLRFKVGALVEQQPDDICVIAIGCSPEGVAVVASLRVNVGALVEQQPDDLCVTAG